jgi:hypothetical protein
MASSATTPELRQRLDHALRLQLGDDAAVVSLREDGEQRLRGVAVCAGRILSFVLEAEDARLRTRPLFDLLQTAAAPEISSVPAAPS